MAARQLGLDLGLLRQQPIEGRVRLIDADRAQAQHRAQRVARRRGIELARRGQFGGGIGHARHDQGQRQQPQARGSRRHQLGGLDARVEPEAAGHPQRRGDIAMWQRALNLKPVAGRQQPLVAQHGAQRGDLPGLPFAQVGEGAVLDLAGMAGGEPRFGTTVTYMRHF